MDWILEYLKSIGVEDDQLEAAKVDLSSRIDKEIEGLKSKNLELINDKKKLRKTAQDAEQELEDAKESLSGLKQKLETTEAQLSSREANDPEKNDELREKFKTIFEAPLRAEIEKLTAEIKTATQRAETAEGALDRALINDAFEAAMTENHIKPSMRKAVSLLLRDEAEEIEIERDEKTAVILIDSLPVSDFVKSWASQEGNDIYVEAPANNGTGANGTKGNRGKQIDNPFLPETKNVTTQGKLYNEDRDLYNRFKSEAQAKGVRII